MQGFVWDVDPVMISIGPFQLRYYGLLFVATVLGGYYFFQKQMKKYGYPSQVYEDYLLWGIFATIIGARLAHCLFYETGYFLNNPVEIVKFWKSGLSSHGATVGLFVSALWFARVRKIPFAILGDGIVFAAALAATLVRIGNFMNSEIVGRATSVPWGVHFMRYKDHGMYLRHPSQLYEAAGGLSVLLSLFVVEYVLKGKKRPGIFSGVFLIGYFTFRFLVEFVKEFQVDQNDTFPLTMGQCLSIPFVIIGLVIVLRALRLTPEEIERLLPQSECLAPAIVSPSRLPVDGNSKKRRKRVAE
jgi:prolipoprotein diacylglyceryl transferase